MEELFLTQREARELANLIPKLVDFDSVMQALQTTGFGLSEARILFDSVIDKYPDMTKYISDTATIIHTPVFDRAIIKIVKGREDSLDEEEKESVKLLLLSDVFSFPFQSS